MSTTPYTPSLRSAKFTFTQTTPAGQSERIVIDMRTKLDGHPIYIFDTEHGWSVSRVDDLLALVEQCRRVLATKERE